IKAYFDFCDEHAIEPHDIEPYLDITGHKGRKAVVEKVMQFEELPDAIIAHSDQVASFIISEFNKLNIKMPEETSVVGFDNLLISELMDFTSVDYLIN